MKYLTILLMMATPVYANGNHDKNSHDHDHEHEPVIINNYYPDDRGYNKAAGAFSAATGAMILGGIDFTSDTDIEVGVGVGNIGGHTGVGVKVNVPIGNGWSGSIGHFRIEDGKSGSTASLVYRF